MDTEHEYEAREAGRFRKELDEVERAPLADRRDARKDWTEAMIESPDIIGERVVWLLDGSYGKGAYDMARSVLANPRMNRAAWMAQTVAALDWHCPAAFAREAFKALTPAWQGNVNGAIEAAMRRVERDIADEAARHPTTT